MPSNASTLKIAYLPLLDAAPLLLAQELGYFQDAGLRVELSREVSWANIRDKLCVKSLQGALLLAPMIISVSMGLNRVKTPLVTSYVNNLNGNAITVSNSLREQLRNVNPEALASAHTSVLSLKALIDWRREQGMAALTFAVVYPYSCHNYLLRYWLGAGGINPDHDLNLVVIPPAQMVAQLAAGRIDGFCVGEPWSQVAMAQGHGRILLNTHEICHNVPEKMLAMGRDWADAEPAAHQQLITALIRSSTWLEDSQNRMDAIAILSQPQYLGFTPDILQQGLRTGKHVFHQHTSNYPWPVQGLWLLSQMLRWGNVPAVTNPHELIKALYRPDVYEAASASLGVPVPVKALEQLGYHAAPWQFGNVMLGADRFIDGIRFQSENFEAYLKQFEISNLNF